ncbi:MAG: 50S ribosomal protein L24, partial [Desulfamplus sp.]|nr:50S ribosomal protein L24 [Desulfamplus sp.]
NKCISPVRIGVRELENGKKVRFCRKCNEQIDA